MLRAIAKTPGTQLQQGSNPVHKTISICFVSIFYYISKQAQLIAHNLPPESREIKDVFTATTPNGAVYVGDHHAIPKIDGLYRSATGNGC
jgi:hypothetical protein